MSEATFVPLTSFHRYPVSEMTNRSENLYQEMKRRRTIRQFSDTPVPLEIIEKCIAAAGTAPSGANLQPWHFVIVKDPVVKHRIRLAAEKEEYEFYTQRAPKEWLEALALLGTDEDKPFLESAPYLIAIFVQSYGLLDDGQKMKHYYATESVGIATGILITALHLSGLAILTHTPSPMNFLSRILERPANERAFLLLVAGYPASDAVVPTIEKKSLAEIATLV